MIFESNREYDELVGDVTQALNTLGKKKDKNPKPKSGHDDLPPESYEPPSDGHSDSVGDPNVSSKNQPKYDGPFIEDLEARLCRIILENQPITGTSTAQRPATGQPVPTTGVEGTSAGTEDPSSLTTPSKAARHASKARAGGKVQKDAEEQMLEKLTKTPEQEEMEAKGEELAQRETEQATPGPSI